MAGPARPRPRAGLRPGGVLLARPVPGAGRARVDGALRRAARPPARNARRRRAGGLRDRGARGARRRRPARRRRAPSRRIVARAGRRSAAAQRRTRAGDRRARAAWATATPTAPGRSRRAVARGHDLTLVAAEVLEEVGTRARRGAAQPDRARRRSRCPSAGGAFASARCECLGQRPLRAVRAPRAPRRAPASCGRSRTAAALRADILRGGDLHCRRSGRRARSDAALGARRRRRAAGRARARRHGAGRDVVADRPGAGARAAGAWRPSTCRGTGATSAATARSTSTRSSTASRRASTARSTCSWATASGRSSRSGCSARDPGAARAVVLEEPPGPGAIDLGALAAVIVHDAAAVRIDRAPLVAREREANPRWDPGDVERSVRGIEEADSDAIVAALNGPLRWDLVGPARRRRRPDARPRRPRRAGQLPAGPRLGAARRRPRGRARRAGRPSASSRSRAATACTATTRQRWLEVVDGFARAALG